MAARVAAGQRFAGLRHRGARPSCTRRRNNRLRPGGGLLLSAHLAVGNDVQTVDACFPLTRQLPGRDPLIGAAFWYERELHDLFGVVPETHPRLEPLVLPLTDEKPSGAARCRERASGSRP